MIMGLIGVRGGSKWMGVKKMKGLCGKGLVWWKIEGLENCGEVDEMIVGRDCEKIEERVGGEG